MGWILPLCIVSYSIGLWKFVACALQELPGVTEIQLCSWFTVITSAIGNVWVAAGRFMDLTFHDLWWPWNDLQQFCHLMFTTCTKFHLDTAKFSNLTFIDLCWPWNDLKHFRHLMFTTCTKFHPDKTMSTNLTFDDLGMTFNIFTTKCLLHVPTFM